MKRDEKKLKLIYIRFFSSNERFEPIFLPLVFSSDDVNPTDKLAFCSFGAFDFAERFSGVLIRSIDTFRRFLNELSLESISTGIYIRIYLERRILIRIFLSLLIIRCQISRQWTFSFSVKCDFLFSRRWHPHTSIFVCLFFLRHLIHLSKIKLMTICCQRIDSSPLNIFEWLLVLNFASNEKKKVIWQKCFFAYFFFHY